MNGNNLKTIMQRTLLIVFLFFSFSDLIFSNTVHVVDIKDKTPDEKVLLASIQGILSKKNVLMYLQDNNIFWSETFKDNGLDITECKSIDDLLKKFEMHIKGFVLADLNNIMVAATLAGPLESIIVTEEILKRYPQISKHIDMAYDARGKDEEWLLDYVQESANSYSLDAITQHNPKAPWALIDFSIKNNYICVVCDNNPNLMSAFYSIIKPNSPKYGFGTPYHNEFKDVSLGATHGLFTVPSANTLNLSFYSSFKGKSQQTRMSDRELQKSRAHYVMIMMSDGDNLNWTIGGCISNKKYMGNSQCKEYPINWMYPTIAKSVSGYVHEYYMKNKPLNNYFIGSVSGIGYTYPSNHKQMDVFSEISNESYKKCGIEYSVIMDTLDLSVPGKPVLDNMIYNMPDIKGFYYMDYGNYAKWKGKTFMINNKPVHSFRYRLWLPKDPLEKIADMINHSSRDVTNIDAYSSVVVHVWSYGIDDVIRFINLLDDDVILVNASEFMNLLKHNVLNHE